VEFIDFYGFCMDKSDTFFVWTVVFKKTMRKEISWACWECEESSTWMSYCLLVKRRRVNNLSLTWSDWFLRGRSGSIYSDEFWPTLKKPGSSNYQSRTTQSSNAYFEDRTTYLTLQCDFS